MKEYKYIKVEPHILNGYKITIKDGNFLFVYKKWMNKHTFNLKIEELEEILDFMRSLNEKA